MTREAALLTQHAEKLGSEKGSEAWYLAQSNRGEQLLQSGQAEKAAEIFSNILNALGEEATFDRANTLIRLGRCYRASGRPDLAETQYRDAITVNEALEQNDAVKKQRGAIHTDLADVLTAQGRFAEAREQYREGLKIVQEVGDLRNEGACSRSTRHLGPAGRRSCRSRQELPRSAETVPAPQRTPLESVAHHQLGMALQEAKQWDEAETHLRRAAELRVSQGLIVGPNGAAASWIQLAILNAAGWKAGGRGDLVPEGH